MAESAQDRKHPASQRKIQRARAEGQVARSRDLGHFLALTAFVALLAYAAPDLIGWLGRMLADGLRFDHGAVVAPAAMTERLLEQTLKMLAVLLPLFGAMLLAAVGGSVLAGGWNFTLAALAPNFAKLDPLGGLLRLVSLQQLGETLKACLLAALLGGAGAAWLVRHWTRHAELLAMPLPAALSAGGELLQGGWLLLCAVLALFALLDVPLQRRMLQRRLRMTTEELRKEHKEIEGNIEVKAKVRMRMREMSRRRMLAAVPKADLVVMNPTHYAVALKYDEATMRAPRVVAKGADLLALKIRDLAREAQVPVLQAPPLARALYAHAEVDEEIPARLFSAVAQVLAWVYQLRDAMAAGRALHVAAPVPEVPADLDIVDAGAEGRSA